MVKELKRPNKVIVSIPKRVTKVVDQMVQHKVNTTKKEIVVKGKDGDKGIEKRSKSNSQKRYIVSRWNATQGY